MSGLAAASRRLRIRLSEELGRPYVVRLRAYSGMLVLVDKVRLQSHEYSWETDEPEDSPANVQHLAGIIKIERMTNGMTLPPLPSLGEP